MCKTKDKKVFHELGYYYIVEPKNINEVNVNDYNVVEKDKGKLVNLEFKWFKLEDLTKVDFRPNVLAHKLSKKDYKFEHIITKD